MYKLDYKGSAVWIQAGADSWILHSLQSTYVAHPVSYAMDKGGTFPRGKVAGLWRRHLHLALRLRMGGVVPPVLCMLSWHAQRQILLNLPCVLKHSHQSLLHCWCVQCLELSLGRYSSCTVTGSPVVLCLATLEATPGQCLLQSVWEVFI